MLAVGCQSGHCVVYQIPMQGSQSKMEKYLIRDIHRAPVTSICWSPNAMKVFSGDSRGLVACTEVDYVQVRTETLLDGRCLDWKGLPGQKAPANLSVVVPVLWSMHRIVLQNEWTPHIEQNHCVVISPLVYAKCPGNYL